MPVFYALPGVEMHEMRPWTGTATFVMTARSVAAFGQVTFHDALERLRC